MTEEKAVMEKQDDIAILETIKAMQEEMASLKDEVKLAKEEAIAAKATLATSKGNLTEEMKQGPSIINETDFDRNVRTAQEKYPEKTLVMKKDGQKWLEVFATKPSDWY